MSSRRRNRRGPPAAVELNITAFMNLMVVLVPFLLMTAVFSHITILDLNLPKPGSANNTNKDIPYELRIAIRSNALVLSDNKGGIIKTIKRLKDQHNYPLLKQVLLQVKNRFPDKTDLIILSEKATFYNDLIQVMDTARSYETVFEGEMVQAELFPDISIGDAAKK